MPGSSSGRRDDEWSLHCSSFSSFLESLAVSLCQILISAAALSECRNGKLVLELVRDIWIFYHMLRLSPSGNAAGCPS